jgi:hypothetical protein
MSDMRRRDFISLLGGACQARRLHPLTDLRELYILKSSWLLGGRMLFDDLLSRAEDTTLGSSGRTAKGYQPKRWQLHHRGGKAWPDID